MKKKIMNNKYLKNHCECRNTAGSQRAQFKLRSSQLQRAIAGWHAQCSDKFINSFIFYADPDPRGLLYCESLGTDSKQEVGSGVKTNLSQPYRSTDSRYSRIKTKKITVSTNCFRSFEYGDAAADNDVIGDVLHDGGGLTRHQGQQHRRLVQVPEQEQLAPAGRGGADMTEQVGGAVPEYPVKAEDHL